MRGSGDAEVSTARAARDAFREVYLRPLLLGAIDGLITSFVIVAGGLASGASRRVVLLIGFSSLVADGLSMAVSEGISSRAQDDRVTIPQAVRLGATCFFGFVSFGLHAACGVLHWVEHRFRTRPQHLLFRHFPHVRGYRERSRVSRIPLVGGRGGGRSRAGRRWRRVRSGVGASVIHSHWCLVVDIKGHAGSQHDVRNLVHERFCQSRVGLFAGVPGFPRRSRGARRVRTRARTAGCTAAAFFRRRSASSRPHAHAVETEGDALTPYFRTASPMRTCVVSTAPGTSSTTCSRDSRYPHVQRVRSEKHAVDNLLSNRLRRHAHVAAVEFDARPMRLPAVLEDEILLLRPPSSQRRHVVARVHEFYKLSM